MPNVEIHGMIRGDAAKLKDKIFKIFKDKPFVNEMVVTIYSTIVRDKNDKTQPFIRLVIPDGKHTHDILWQLQFLGLEIEHLKLEGFISKSEQK